MTHRLHLLPLLLLASFGLLGVLAQPSWAADGATPAQPAATASATPATALDIAWEAFNTRDYATAFRDFSRIAGTFPRGSSESQDANLVLWLLYETGTGVARDVGKAKESARLLDDRRVYDILRAVMYPNGEMAIADWEEALRLTLRRTFGQREGESLDRFNAFIVAQIYHQGIGVHRNRSKAEPWLRQLAERGFVHPMYQLGRMYREGDGVAKDLQEGERWLRRASDRGHAQATAVLQGQEVVDVIDAESVFDKPIHATRCEPASDFTQAGFVPSEYLPAFRDFQRRLAMDWRTAKMEIPLELRARKQMEMEWVQPYYANSVDAGVKGRDMIAGIYASIYGYTPPMQVIMAQVVGDACPVGFGGTFTDDLGQRVELWYVDLWPQDHSTDTAIKNPRVPAFGTLERNVFPTLVFKRDAAGRLMWYGVSMEMGKIMSYWAQTIFQ